MAMERVKRNVLSEGNGNFIRITYIETIYVCDMCVFIESCPTLGVKNCEMFMPHKGADIRNGIKIGERLL